MALSIEGLINWHDFITYGLLSLTDISELMFFKKESPRDCSHATHYLPLDNFKILFEFL